MPPLLLLPSSRPRDRQRHIALHHRKVRPTQEMNRDTSCRATARDTVSASISAPLKRWTATPLDVPLQGTRPLPPPLPRRWTLAPLVTPPQGTRPLPPPLTPSRRWTSAPCAPIPQGSQPPPTLPSHPGDGQRHHVPHHREDHGLHLRRFPIQKITNGTLCQGVATSALSLPRPGDVWWHCVPLFTTRQMRRESVRSNLGGLGRRITHQQRHDRWPYRLSNLGPIALPRRLQHLKLHGVLLRATALTDVRASPQHRASNSSNAP